MSWKALSHHVRELRVHLCQTGSGSQGVRDFIKSSYANIKNENPGFPFLIREAEGVQAKMTARFDYGAEAGELLEGADAKKVEATLKSLIERGSTMNQSSPPA